MMFVRRLVAVSLCLTAALSVSILQADEEKKQTETVAVKLKDVVLNLPKDWEASDTVSTMRLATYHIPAAEGEQEKGELVVSSFGGDGGGVAANLDRWVGQFDAEGRDVEITKGTAGENVYHIANISGTYQKPVGPPVLGKKKPSSGYRMLGVILQVKGKGVYFLKLTGPDATVKAQEETLRTAFGGKSEGEEDYEI